MKQRIYLSGPISDIEHEVAFNAFEDAEIIYGDFNNGAGVYNPMTDPINQHIHSMQEKCLLSKKEAWQRVMKNCIGWLVRCDEIVMLPGWEKSKGAKMEHDIAKELGMKITYTANIGMRTIFMSDLNQTK